MSGYGSENGVERANAERFVVRNRQPLMTWGIGLQNDVAAFLVQNLIIPIAAERFNQFRAAYVPGELSCPGQNFVPNQVQPDLLGRLWLVKVKGAHGFLYVLTQRRPGVALGEDVFGKALGTKAAVFLLRHFKNQFVHALTISAHTGALASL
jgi:hypothetical protein